MRLSALVLVMLVLGCGRSDMLVDGMPAALSSVDAGGVNAGGVNAGGVNAGERDAGEPDAGMWCAPSGERCLVDGWRYDVPGRCCNSRQTCEVTGRSMRCEY